MIKVPFESARTVHGGLSSIITVSTKWMYPFVHSMFGRTILPWTEINGVDWFYKVAGVHVTSTQNLFQAKKILAQGCTIVTDLDLGGRPPRHIPLFVSVKRNLSGPREDQISSLKRPFYNKFCNSGLCSSLCVSIHTYMSGLYTGCPRKSKWQNIWKWLWFVELVDWSHQ